MTCKETRIEETTIASVAGHPADPEPTTVLHLSAPLTLAMAEALKCRDMVFTVNDNARQFEGKITLPLALGEGDAELVLPTPGGGRHTMRPVKIHKFTVGHESDLKLEVSFRAHFKGEAEAQVISDLLHGWNKTEFFTTIISTQGELFAEKAPAADAGDGTKVDMTVDGPLFEKPKKPKSGCKHCDASIPLKERDDSEHVNGEGCKLWDQPANPLPPMETAVLQEGPGLTAAEKKKARLAEEKRKKEAREATEAQHQAADEEFDKVTTVQ